MLAVAVVLSLIRIIIGPTIADRIIGLDLLAGVVIAGMVVSGLASGNPFYLQAVLGFALILFLGTVALARFLDHPENDDS